MADVYLKYLCLCFRVSVVFVADVYPKYLWIRQIFGRQIRADTWRDSGDTGPRGTHRCSDHRHHRHHHHHRHRHHHCHHRHRHHHCHHRHRHHHDVPQGV